MSLIKKVINARWFPTVTKPLLAGALASGVTFGLHAVGVTAFVPGEVNGLATAIAGLLVTAIVQTRPVPASVGTVQVQAVTATHITQYKPEATLGGTIAQAFVQQLGEVIDNDPSLLNSLGAQALERVLHPQQESPPQVAVSFAPAFGGGVEPTVMPASTAAPHITQ